MRERAVNAASEDRKVCSFEDLGPFYHFLQQTLLDKAFFYFFVITQITEGLFEGKDSKSGVIILTGFFSKRAWPFLAIFTANLSR